LVRLIVEPLLFFRDLACGFAILSEFNGLAFRFLI
jgi:hypothetical protein